MKLAVGILVFGSLLLLPALPRVAQDPCYHDFADQRVAVGIPHFWNVVSNLPFLLVGVLGLLALRGHPTGLRDPRERAAWALLFAGALLTGVGSTWYHLAPENGTLFWDRLPLGVTSIAVLLIVLQETVSLRLIRHLTWPLAAFAAASSVWWMVTEAHGDGDLRAYAWCLAAPVLAVLAAMTVLPPRYTATRRHLVLALAFYAGARVTELLDHEVDALPLIWSGHTWKHLLAAGAIATLLRWLRHREPLNDGAGLASWSPTSRLRKLLLTLGWSLVFYAGSSALATEFMLHPARREPTSLPQGEGAETFEVTTRDGVRIEGSALAPRASRGIVILLHGLGGARVGARMEAVARAGFRAVAIDLRAHGRSGGDTTTFGEREARDFEATLSWVRGRWPEEPVAAWGTSLGAAAIVCSNASGSLDAVVLESLYATLAGAYENRLRLHLPRWLTWAGTGLRWCAEARLGFGAETLDLTRRIHRLDAERVLLTTGARDRRAPPEDSDRLARVLSGARVEIVPSADHDSVWRAGGAAWRATVLGFLRERMR